MDRLIRVEKVNNPMGRATMSCSTSILFFDSLLSVLCVVGLRTNNSISLYSCLFSLCSLPLCVHRAIRSSLLLSAAAVCSKKKKKRRRNGGQGGGRGYDLSPFDNLLLQTFRCK